MADSAVVNASPLILLARAGHIELLKLAADLVIVPKPVADEICGGVAADAAVTALQSLDWLQTEDPGTVSPAVARWNLGPGESSVLTWALAHPGAEAIIDDLMGRRCAKVLGVPVRGTLGLVLTAKLRKRIPEARPVVEQLRSCGMYLSKRVLDGALAKIGE